MTALKERHLNHLRGSRFRKARRYLKRNPGSYVQMATHDGSFIVFGPPVYGDGVYDVPDVMAMGEPVEIPTVISVEAPPYACHVCGAVEPNPCVTKTGNKAKQRHAGRDTL